MKKLSDNNLIATEDQARRYRDRGNPYWKLSDADYGEPGTAKTSSTIEGFELECRRIFGQYMPAFEKGKLRANYREFIARNASRGAHIRQRILLLLQKYDLSTLHGFANQFNREREEFAEDTLRKIEQAAAKED